MKRRKRVKSARAKAGTKKPRTKFLKDGTVKEAFVQAEILAWLRTTGLMHWRSNSGSLFLHGRHINLGPLGCADISLVLPTHGTFVGMEVKSAKGAIRKDQITYAKGLTDQGGKYFIVRSLEEAQNAVAECLGDEQWKRLSEPKRDGSALTPQPLRLQDSLPPQADSTLTLSPVSPARSSSRPRKAASPSPRTGRPTTMRQRSSSGS